MVDRGLEVTEFINPTYLFSDRWRDVGLFFVKGYGRSEGLGNHTLSPEFIQCEPVSAGPVQSTARSEGSRGLPWYLRTFPPKLVM